MLTMKKLLLILGYITTLLIAIYAVFKFVKIYYANIVMLIAGLAIAIYFPLVILSKYQVRQTKKLQPVYKFGAFLLFVLILSFVFSLQHWNIFYRQGDEVIILFSIPSWIIYITYLCFSLIFIPWLIYVRYREDKNGLGKNITAGIGLALISVSLICYQLHLPFQNELFIIVNVLFVIVYLPWHILSSAKKDSMEFQDIFQTLIIAYILVLFVYGVLLKWPTTYQDRIMH